MGRREWKEGLSPAARDLAVAGTTILDAAPPLRAIVEIDVKAYYLRNIALANMPIVGTESLTLACSSRDLQTLQAGEHSTMLSTFITNTFVDWGYVVVQAGSKIPRRYKCHSRLSSLCGSLVCVGSLAVESSSANDHEYR